MPKINLREIYTRTGIVIPENRKPLHWEGSSKKNFKEFPIPVQKDMGVRYSSCSWAAPLILPSHGEGTARESTSWSRIIGVAPFAPSMVRIGDVLHAFQKKSRSGTATPRPDVELIEKRMKSVLARYEASRRVQ
nr:hypothetical protein [Peristeroidobacter agariperforans]